jgi:probable phosphoglycerate mutase
MKIVLVRHAQPDWEPDGRAVDEPGLTQLGHQQARRVADALAGEHFDALYVSPHRRALETARPIAEKLGLEPRVESWLRELGVPTLQGKTTQEVRRFFADSRARDLAAHFEGVPDGESFRHFHERVSGGLEGLLLEGHRFQIHMDAGHRLWRLPEERRQLLIVAHEGTNAILLSHLLGLEPLPWAWLHFSSAWAGITSLHLTPVASGAVWSLEGFNRVQHLEGLEGQSDGRTGSA